MNIWLEEILKSEYKFLKYLKNEDNSSVMVMANKHNGKKVVVKKFKGDCQVYKCLTQLEHKNLPVVYEAIYDGENSIVLEEFIDGITVGDVLQTGCYTNDGVREVIKEVANALSILHSHGIIHRDIKPENIMITNDGGVKLIDFNIARLYKETDSRTEAKDTTILGTVGFAAPEQFGISQSDARTDIYSLGILINVMLTGEHPSKKLCDGKWKKVVQKCTQINPKDRYKSVREIMSSKTYLLL